MKLSAEIAGQEKEVTIEEAAPGRFRIAVDGVERIVDGRRLGQGTWSLLLGPGGDEVVTVDIEAGRDRDLLCDVRGTVVPVKAVDARRRLLEKAQAAAGAAHKGPLPIAAPMPGKVVKLLVKPGESIASSQAVAVVEAMKMENEIRSPRAGTVQAVHVKEGQTVEGQETLVTVE